MSKDHESTSASTMQTSFKSIPTNETWTLLDKMIRDKMAESLSFTSNSVKPNFQLGGSCLNAFTSTDIPQRYSLFSNGDDSTSFVVLDQSPLEEIEEKCLTDFKSIQEKSMSIDYDSIISSMSPNDVQKKLSVLLQENAKLKETLTMNNEAMKKQFTSLATWQEQMLSIHNNHKKRFAETRELINQLKRENFELKSKIASSVNEESSLKTSNVKEKDSKEQNINESDHFKETSIKETLNESKDTVSCGSQTIIEKINVSKREEVLISEKDESLFNSLEKNEKKDKQNEQKLMEFDENLYEEIHNKILDLQKTFQEHDDLSMENIQSTKDTEEILAQKQQLITTMNRYKQQLQVLNDSYAATRLRFCLVEESMVKCEAILHNLSLSNIIQKELTPECQNCLQENELEIRKIHSQLTSNAVKYADESRKLFEMQKLYQQIFWDYKDLVNELERIKCKNAKSRELEEAQIAAVCKDLENSGKENEERRLKLNCEKKLLEEELDSIRSARINYDEEIKKVHQEREKLREERNSLDRQSKLYEAQEKSLRIENKHLHQKCENLSEERKTEMENMEIVINDLRLQMENMKKEVRNKHSCFAD